MPDLTPLNKAMFRAKQHQDAVVQRIVEALPEDEWDRGWLLDVFVGDPNNLVDLLEYYGVYAARIDWGHNRITSEPVNGAKVPRLEHLYCGHRDARVEIVD